MLSGNERVHCRRAGFDLHRLSLESGGGVLEAVNCNVPTLAPQSYQQTTGSFQSFP